MAEETPRLRLPRYTSGSDLHPTREDFNDRMGLIDEQVAVARQGNSADRPMPSTPGLYWLETDTRLLYIDTGAEWVRIVRIGHDGPGRPLRVGQSTGSEGSSNWAARADHTHPLPLASRDNAGAMSSSEKAMLDDASVNIDGGSNLVRRNAQGRFNSADPSVAENVTNKRYVDDKIGTRAPSSHNHAASQITSGTLAPARLPAATTGQQGALSAADKAKLNGATNQWSGNAASSLVQRDSESRFRAADPVHVNDVANQRWVNSRINTRAPSSHNHDARDINSGTLTGDRIPNLPTSKITTGTFPLVRIPNINAERVSSGVLTPNRIPDLPASRIASGTFARVRLPSATSSSQGAVTEARIQELAEQRARELMEPVMMGSTNLNSRTTPGQFYPGPNTSASEANNFPPGAHDNEGVLEVLRHISNSVMQRYTVAVGAHPMWVRRRWTTGSWSPWVRVGG